MVFKIKEVEMILTRDDLFKQLEFVSVTRNKRYSEKDVSVRVIDGNQVGGKKYYKRLSLIFRNDITDLLGDGDRISIARYKGRLIIIKDPNGLKLTGKSEDKNRFVRFQLNESTLSTYGYFEGDYDLKYDELYEYYYIEKDAPAANETRPMV